MTYKIITIGLCKFLFIFFIILNVVACGGDSSSVEIDPPPTKNTPFSVTNIPENQISHSFFRDVDGTENALAGRIVIEAPDIIETDLNRAESVWVYWADNNREKLGGAWLKTTADAVYEINIPTGTNLPENTKAMLLYPANNIGQSKHGRLVLFHDFIGNASLFGPGGNEAKNWFYGEERPALSVQRSDINGGLCTFDNGLVSIIDMNNTRDEAWHNSIGDGQANVVDETNFPPYEFLCDETPIHKADEISDEIGIWTYSTLNDSLFYGTLTYDMFLKYLGEPPLKDKVRLRVHYGVLSDRSVFWDGAYANFSDGYPFQYSMAPLDVIGHEVAHGVLNRISDLDFFEHSISTDARTLHEAFADISGVMVKYEFTGHKDNWEHGAEAKGYTRHLDKIETEFGAIDSFLDYDDAGDNFYLRIGVITYPFYLLSNKWGIEPAYKVYLSAAKNCWLAMTTLTEAADCVKQEADTAGLSTVDVVEAFKTVKIKLFEDGVLSHFKNEKYKLRSQFIDNSESTNQITQWLWDFGDGTTSTAVSPEHTFEDAGDYQVALTVTDQSGDQDVFKRLISVTDQYCAIKPHEVDKHITSLSIDGTSVSIDPTRSDYTQKTIVLSDSSHVVINIEGDVLSTEKSTTWSVWIDINDNGVFGDDDKEFVLNQFVAQGQPYELHKVLDFSKLPNNGDAVHMRIVGDYAVITACNLSVGEALDVKISW